MSDIGRRGFLQCIIVIAGASSCSSEDESGPPGPKPGTNATVEDGFQYFPQSVASGDPKPTSVVLWTRVEDATGPKDIPLSLEVSTTFDFRTTVVKKEGLIATADHDGILKVKVVGLTPGNTYYYRFLHSKGGPKLSSQVGRTRTAPDASADKSVHLAVASCQDFIGRYYNSWQVLIQEDPDLDAVLFIGDYVYETTGDPAFQSMSETRKVKFRDEAGALKLGTAEKPYFAAKSLSNYRDLYRTYRSDALLQQVHESWPFIVTWDDHEFSNDSYGASGTYFDGIKDEKDETRKRNAELAFFEYMPIDLEEPEGAIDPAKTPVFPATRIWRDLELGKHVRLLVTDYRTYRPDHLIPEDAWPAAIIVEEAEMKTSGLYDKFNSNSFSYIDIDEDTYSGVKYVMKEAVKVLAAPAGLDDTAAAAKADELVKGNQALVFVNAVLTKFGAAPIDPEGKPKGLGWVHFGKRDLYATRGARYIILKDTFDAWAAYRYGKSAGKSEDVFGAAQDKWLKDTLASATNTWKVVVSSVTLTELVLDFRTKTDIPDTSLQNRFYAQIDGWDGFPTKRKELFDHIASKKIPNVCFVAGDIHGSFASVEGGVPVITTPAISSGSFQELVKGFVLGAGYDATTAVYKYAVTELDKTTKEGNPGIVHANNADHGITLLEFSATGAKASFFLVPGDAVTKSYTSDKTGLAKLKYEKAFTISAGKITPA
jgi:alkaline phosphatase D